MRTEAVNFRTWLLGATAVWAVLVLVLSLAGLGSRVQSLPDSVDSAVALPRSHVLEPNRLGALDQYTGVSSRPLLMADRKPRPFFIEGNGPDSGASPSSFDYVLTSVLITPDFRMAILKPAQEGAQPIRIRQGETLSSAPGWRLNEVQPRRAVFVGPGGQRELNLRIFDDKGGRVPESANAGNVTMAGGAPVPEGEMIGEPLPPGTPSSTTTDSTAYPPPPSEDAPASNAAPSQEQMEQIRRRIQERRAQLRQTR
ncbi:MAG: hypothetical protein LBV45_10775 [Xanthomonadaceae bacterium]|jgi:general secretion pathway protein N|nr:hypothetical protein [Xanthomonadaceae bacterium]